MTESFFFVPGTRLHKIDHMMVAGATHIIIDLEDAVKKSDRDGIILQLKADSNIFKNYFVRVPIFDGQDIDKSLLDILYEAGYKNFVIPKLRNESDVLELVSDKVDIKLIVLIENVEFFLNAINILEKIKSNIFAIGLGSHDFMAQIGGVHNLKNLEYPRTQLLYWARLLDVIAIDIASMEINNKEHVQAEIIDGFEKGYDAKFYIHPNQMEFFNELELYSIEELNWANEVLNILENTGTVDEFNPIVINGKVIERPHIYKSHKIKRYYERKSLR